MRKILTVAGIAATLALAGCGDGLGDLRAEIDKAKQRPGGRIQPLPEVRPYVSYEYQMSERRSPFLPDVATIAEQGIQGVVAVGWIGLSAPARTPEPILDKISAEVMRILKEPEVLDKLKGLAFVPAKESRQEFEAYIALENVKWKKIVQDAGVKIE